jgi:hypothetical protein
MTVFIIGLGSTAEGWFNHPHDISIGVNDSGKWGKDTDYLLLIDSLPGFKREPERVKTIGRSKAKILTNGDTWKSIFPKYEVLRLKLFGKQLKKGHYYSSKSSPFVALSVAFNLGATDIVLFGVDMKTHKLFYPGSRMQDYELRNIEKMCRMLKDQGVNVFVSSKESALSKFLNVWNVTKESAICHHVQ